MGGGGRWNLRDSLNGKDNQVRCPVKQTRKLLTVRRSEDLGAQTRLEPSRGAGRCLNLDRQPHSTELPRLRSFCLGGREKRNGSVGCLSVP